MKTMKAVPNINIQKKSPVTTQSPILAPNTDASIITSIIFVSSDQKLLILSH